MESAFKHYCYVQILISINTAPEFLGVQFCAKLWHVIYKKLSYQILFDCSIRMLMLVFTFDKSVYFNLTVNTEYNYYK